MFFVALVVDILFIFYTSYALIKQHDKSLSIDKRRALLNATACTNPIWLIISVFELVVVLFFVRGVISVNYEVVVQMNSDREIYGYNDHSHFDKMTTNLGYLWMLIKFYLLFSVYLVVFNIVTLVNAIRIEDLNEQDPEKYQFAKFCSVITGNLYVDEWFYFISRGYTFFMWLFPIIYIFWKQKADWAGLRAYHSSLNAQRGTEKDDLNPTINITKASREFSFSNHSGSID